MPRSSPTETPQRRPDPVTLFTDRERERAMLEELLAPTPTPREHPERFLTTFYGVGGAGKSALAAKARAAAGEYPDVTLVTLDFDTSRWSVGSPWVAVASELVRALVEGGMPCRLSAVLLSLHAVQALPRGDTASTRALELGLEGLDKGIEFAQGVPGLGLLLKSCQWLYDRAQRHEVELIARDLGLWPVEDNGHIDLQKLEEKIAQALFEDVRGFLEMHPQRHLRLLIDGFERIQGYDRRVDAQRRFQDLLGYCAASPAWQAFVRLRVVLFGREKLRWDDLYEADWAQHWRQHRISGLAERDARVYLHTWARWFERTDQTALAQAVSASAGEMLRASAEGEPTDDEYSPFYLALAVDLVERATAAGTVVEFGRTSAELEDRFLRYLEPRECRALMVLALVESVDEALFDWLAEHRVIDYAVHTFHSALRQDHCYFQQTAPGAWRFHRLFEQALRSRWMRDDTARREAEAVIRRLLDYYAESLVSTPERGWTDDQVQAWTAGMEVLTQQGLEGELLSYDEWHTTANAAPWSSDSFKCSRARSRLLERVRVVQERRRGVDHPDTLRSVSNLAMLLQAQGERASAEPLLRRALEGYERVLGPDHPHTLRSLNNLGMLLWNQGEWAAAELLFRRALEGYERVLGSDHPDTLTSVNNLAMALQTQGEWPTAEPLYRRALEGLERVLGPEHSHTLTSVNNLALLLQAQGKWAAAEPLFRRALDGLERILGHDAPQTLTSLNNLASLLQAQGAWAAAEPLYRRALEGRERILGTDHPDTLTSVNELALLLQAQGEWAAAEPLLRRALEGCERILGTDHPDTLTSVNNLAMLLQAAGEWAAAEPLLRGVLKKREHLLGTRHPDTLTSVNNLALLLWKQGDWTAAEPLYRRALEARERVLGPEHSHTLTSVNNLALLLQAQGEWAAAEPLFRRALEGFERILGPDHVDTLTSVNNLALLLWKRGDWTAAEPLLRRALEGFERIHGTNHPNALLSVNNLAGLLQAQGEWAAAEPLYRRALEARERILGTNHPDTLTSVSNLAGLLEAQGERAAAEPLYRRALEARKRILGTDHPDTLTSVSNLAGLLEAQGERAAAEPLYRQALEGRERVLGTDHLDTLGSVNNLASLLEAQGEWAQAEPLFHRVLEGCERVLGADHSVTQRVTDNLERFLQAKQKARDGDTSYGPSTGRSNS